MRGQRPSWTGGDSGLDEAGESPVSRESVGRRRYRAERAAWASRRRKTARPLGIVASSATSPTPCGRVTIAARRPSRLASSPVASSPPSSESKARKTLGQPLSVAATRSTPLAPRAAQAGMSQAASVSQSKTPSVTTTHCGARPSLPIPSAGFGPGGAWKPGLRVGADGPPLEPADGAACDLRNDHHAGEPLPASLHKQSRSSDPPLGEAVRLKRPPQPVSRRVTKSEPNGSVRSDAARGEVVKSG